MKNEPLPLDETQNIDAELEEAYEVYRHRIMWYMLRRTENAKLAEDLASTVFEKAWKSRKSFRGGSIGAWLFQISRNVLTDYWRKKKDVPLEDFDTYPSDDHDMGDTLDASTRAQALWRSIDKLPPTMHAIVIMRFMERRPTKEVASVMNMSEGNVRIMQYRALKRIKKDLKL